MKIKRGTRKRGWALKNSNKNAAFRLVSSILNNRSHFNNFVRNRNQNYVLVNNGVLKAFAFLGRNKYYEFPIVNLIGAAPGKGYGSALMNRIKANAASKGYEVIFIHDPVPNARNWYKSKFGAKTASPINSGNTTVLRLSTGKRKRSPTPTSRPPNKQTEPSRQSPKRPSSSQESSAQRPSRRQKHHH